MQQYDDGDEEDGVPEGMIKEVEAESSVAQSEEVDPVAMAAGRVAGIDDTLKAVAMVPSHSTCITMDSHFPRRRARI